MRCGVGASVGSGREEPVGAEGWARCAGREGPGVCGGKGLVCAEGRARCV